MSIYTTCISSNNLPIYVKLFPFGGCVTIVTLSALKNSNQMFKFRRLTRQNKQHSRTGIIKKLFRNKRKLGGSANGVVSFREFFTQCREFFMFFLVNLRIDLGFSSIMLSVGKAIRIGERNLIVSFAIIHQQLTRATPLNSCTTPQRYRYLLPRLRFSQRWRLTSLFHLQFRIYKLNRESSPSSHFLIISK